MSEYYWIEGTSGDDSRVGIDNYIFYIFFIYKMEKAEELSPSPLDALLDAQDVSDTDETILATIQKIEAALGPQK